MSEIDELKYKHYSRLNTIFADEAQRLLASFELRGKNISDPDEYNTSLKKEMILASGVLDSAFDSNDLRFTSEESPYIYDNDDTQYYNFKFMKLNLSDFCTWASKKKYKLPEELAKLSTWSGCEVDETNQDKKNGPKTKTEPTGMQPIAPATDNAKTVDGLLKMVIAMAIKGYSYKPGERSEIVREIMSDIEQVGLSLSENTIRQRLKDASELLSR